MPVKNRILTNIKDYLALTVASFIFAMAWECFMIPNGMAAGGMMGLCTIIQYATGGFIEAQYSYIAINALLIITAVFAMGIGFGFKTIYCIVVSTIAMGLLDQATFLHSVEGNFFYIEETVLIPIIAGVLEAVGIGFVMRFGGSTGGTDIIALMVNKYWPLSLSTIFLITDLLICSLLLFVPGKNFSDMCYGLVQLVTFSIVVDLVVAGQRSSFQLIIFSEKYNVIADHIINNMDRGVTVLKAQGWFSKKDKDVLLVLINRRELSSLTKVIKDADPNAFMSISPTSNVYGEGFDEIKAGVSIKKKKTKE